MNSYDLGISGNWFFLVILLIISVLFTVYTYYRTNPPINKRRKSILVLLRSVGMSLLIFSLFEPVLTGFRSKVIEPKIAVLFDNSLSMQLDDAGGNRLAKYKSAYKNSKISDFDEDQSYFRTMGETSKLFEKFTFDSLNLSENSSDMSIGFKSLFSDKEEQHLKAVVIFTDGSYNAGSNPVYSAEELSLPVFAIGIGDSTEPKDISIQTLLLNEVAYIDNPVPVNANVKCIGFKGEELNVMLYDNDKLIETQKVKVDDEVFETTSYFVYTPKEAGNRKISVRIDNRQSEISVRNNSISDFIKVLKNKRIISIFAGAPSPDLSFIKQYLTTLKGVEIREFIQSSGSNFYKTPTEKDLSETELFVLVGFPINSTPDAILDKISRELSNNKPIFLITSLNFDFNKLRKIEEYLPFNTASSRSSEFSITPDFNPKSLSNPLMRINGTDDDIDKWKNLPPIFRTETFVRPKPESEIVATFKVNNVPLSEPLIITRTVNSKKSVAIIGYGIYRWRLIGLGSELSKNRENPFDGFSTLMDNSVRWLSVSDINKKVTIKTTKKNYSKQEKVEFTAQVYDASYLPVDNAIVNVSVKGKNEDRSVTLVSSGNGRYYAAIEGMQSGDYSFSGEAVKNSQKIGSDDGRFTIGEIDAEHRNLRMQIETLRTLAEMSGGKFYYNGNTSSLIDDIKKLKGFQAKPVTIRNDFALWSYPWVLVIALLMFAIEWIIRKRGGMI